MSIVLLKIFFNLIVNKGLTNNFNKYYNILQWGVENMKCDKWLSTGCQGCTKVKNCDVVKVATLCHRLNGSRA